MTSQPFSLSAGAGAGSANARNRIRTRGRRRARNFQPGTPTGSAGVPGRVLALLTALAAALGAAFVYAPRLVAASAPGGGFSDQRSLIAYLRDAFVGYWGSGSRNYSPQMQRIVDYWVRYHVAKAVIAALLLGVLSTLAVLLWRSHLRAELGALGRFAVVSAWGFAAMLALFAVAVLAANIQGALAPFSSLLSMLPAAEPDKQFTATLDQVRSGLAHYPSPDGRTSPVLQGMVDDFAFYHAALVAVAAVVMIALIVFSVLAWRRFARVKGDRRARRAFAGLGVATIVVLLGVAVVTAANVSTVADPAPALLASFQGSW